MGTNPHLTSTQNSNSLFVNSLTGLSLLTHYLFIRIFVQFLGQKKLRHVIKQAQNTAHQQRGLLSEILDHNAETEIGRKFQFAAINSAQEYKKVVPLQTYDDVKDSVRRIRDEGKQNVLCKDEVGTLGSELEKKLFDCNFFLDFAACKHVFGAGILAGP